MAPFLLVLAFFGPVCGAAALLLAERWARTRGLVRAQRQVAAQLDTQQLALSVEGRPLLPALLRRGGTAATVRATDVPVGDDARLRDLEAYLPGVRVDLRRRLLLTDGGTFAATIDERELAGLVRVPGVVSRLELGQDGLRVWTVLGLAVDADVLVTDGALHVIPDPAQLAPLLRLPGVSAFRRVIEGAGLRLELPRLPFDAVVESLTFTAGQVEARGRLAAQRLPLR